MINIPSVINLDFADVQTVMKDKGIAHIGIGTGTGDDKAMDAIRQAVESPLLETTISGATDIIINVSGDITLNDTGDAASYIEDIAGEDINVILGAMYDETMKDTCTITVIATGIEDNINKLPVKGFVTPPSAHIPTPPVKRPVAEPTPVVAPAPVANAENPVPMPARPYAPAATKPVDIRSRVDEKTLKIPDFFKK